MNVDAGDVEGIEHRVWLDDPDETRELDRLTPKMRGTRGKVSRLDASDYAELIARRNVRRELASIRRMIEDWTTPDALRLKCNDDYEAGAVVNVLRDLATIIDERVSARGGREEGAA